ncbi:MAG: hypothetical protein CV088_07830 [Nitrospira sp. LK70]|nr:hypothetical protein [Nitrospira sp. LK70]
MRANKKLPLKSDKTQASHGHKRGVVGYSRKTALLEEAITQMNAGKYGRSSVALKELLTLDPHNMEARRLFATLHLRLGSLIPAREAFDSLISEAFQRQDYWLAESLLREYLAAGPRCVPFLEKLGTLYQEKGDALEAAAEYAKAIDILIEDPDPDNPRHAPLLYAKIRELAPASPEAFRLASFFDAQTGELLARQPSESGQSIVAPSLDMLEGGQGTQAGCEPVDGVMPREIQDAQTMVPEDRKVVEDSGLSGFPIPPTITDLPAQPGLTFHGELRLADPPLQEQAASSANEGGSDAGEETYTREFKSVPSGPQTDDCSGQVALGGCHPSASSSVPDAERSEAQPGWDPAVSTGGHAEAQQQDSLLAEVEPRASSGVSGSSLVSAPTETADSSVPSLEPTVQSLDATGGTLSSQMEEISAPASLNKESSIAGPIEAEDRQPSLQQPVDTNSKEVVAEASPETSAPSNPESVSANEISAPWKQPGFSWESVFNSAWKFGSDHSANVSPAEVTQTNVEEALPAVASPPQEQVLEHQAVEIPKREESVSLRDQTASGFQIAPMPWDQVQESVISILPAQTAEPDAEDTESAIVQSAGEADKDLVTRIGEDQAQPPISPPRPVAETGAFSITPDREIPVSTEPEIPVADLGQTTSMPESAPALAELDQQLPVVSGPTMSASPPSEASLKTRISSVYANGQVTDDVVSPAAVSSQSAAPVLMADADRTIITAQNLDQESTAEHPAAPSQPTCEPLSGETSEIPSSVPLLTQHNILELPSEKATGPHLSEEPTEVQVREEQPQAVAIVEVRTLIPAPVPEPVPAQAEWVKAGESIRFIEPSQATPFAQAPPLISERQEVTRSTSVAAAAVDARFESSRNVRPTEPHEHVVELKPVRKSSTTLSRARVAIAGFVGSCFSTTRAIVVTCVSLVMLSVILMVLGIGAVGLTWIIMEESPSPAFQRLTTTPQRTLSDFKKNGYFLLLGIDAPVGHDPIQAGYDRKSEVNDGDSASACFGGSRSRTIKGANASADVMRGWVRGSDPLGEFKSHQDTIKGWSNEHQSTLNRYGQWKKLPFEDWGFGQPTAPSCTAMVFAHQLHVSDGFLQGADIGVERLETDMETWRIILGQARTLAVKMLALQAINDDIAIASGLLVRSDFDGKYLGRISKFLRPLDQVELSLRWPMQSELVVASKMYDAQLKAVRAEEQPLYKMVALALPLPVQRRLNAYAEYYDASYKAAGEGRYGSLPKWKTYIHFPASGLTDYFTNPIENIVGLEPLAPWDRYNGFVVDTEAHLRLASLQAWLRRGSLDGDLLTRIAKAGQSFYDPYTGLPMLVNMKKGLLYSVGRDGKDQDADPQSDVVVEIPAVQTSAASAKTSAASSKSR